jgi:hypothetical protein
MARPVHRAYAVAQRLLLTSSSPPHTSAPHLLPFAGSPASIGLLYTVEDSVEFAAARSSLQ